MMVVTNGSIRQKRCLDEPVDKDLRRRFVDGCFANLATEILREVGLSIRPVEYSSQQGQPALLQLAHSAGERNGFVEREVRQFDTAPDVEWGLRLILNKVLRR